MRTRQLYTLLALALGMIVCGSLLAQTPTQGDWRAEYKPAQDGVYLQLRTEPGNSWGFNIQPGELWGLSPNTAQGDHSTAHFELRREAGTLTFDGTFEKGEGWGQFRFAPNADFAQGMRGLGYASLSQDQLFSMTMVNVTREYIQQTQALGYKDLSIDNYIAMKIHGVTPDYIKGMRDAGLQNLSADSLVELRIHGPRRNT